MKPIDDSPLPPDLAELLSQERSGEAAPAEVRGRVHARIVTSIAAGVAASAAASGSHAIWKAAAPKLLAWKVTAVIVGAVGAAAVGLSVYHALGPISPPIPVARRAAQPITSRDDGARAPSELELQPEFEPVAIPRETTTRFRVRPVIARSASEPDQEGLQRERLLLERAHLALSAHDPSGALVVLGDHERRFPRGQLAEERESLWVKTLVVSGDRAAASRRAAEFRAHYPRSLFSRAVDAALLQ